VPDPIETAVGKYDALIGRLHAAGEHRHSALLNAIAELERQLIDRGQQAGIAKRVTDDPVLRAYIQNTQDAYDNIVNEIRTWRQKGLIP
jgi:hypothetical protein